MITNKIMAKYENNFYVYSLIKNGNICFSGKEILQLIKKIIVLIVVDEAHVNLEDQWGNSAMREEMNLAPAFIKAQVVTSTRAPILAMTATAKIKPSKPREKSEVDKIIEMCSLKYSPTTTIYLSPILKNHLYVNLKRPPSRSGFYGKNSYTFSEPKIGLVHILWRLYLQFFVSDIKEGSVPKKAIIYVKRLEDLAELDDFLNSQLGHLPIAQSPNTCPWVINYSECGTVTSKQIMMRSTDETSPIFLYVTTSFIILETSV